MMGALIEQFTRHDNLNDVALQFVGKSNVAGYGTPDIKHAMDGQRFSD